MPIEPQAAALDALAAYLTTELASYEHTVKVRRGWPESHEALDLEGGPEIAITAGNPVVVPCVPKMVDETPDGDDTLYTWRVAFVSFPAQIDVWAPYRVWRDELGQLVQAALFNGLPTRSGLWLPSTTYYSRPLSADVTLTRTEDGSDSAPLGQWRQTWGLEVRSDWVVQSTHPKLEQIDISLSIEHGETTVVATTSVT